MRVGRPALSSIAAAPILPFISDPSVYTFTHSVALLSLIFELSLLPAMLIRSGSLLSNGLRTAIEIFSIYFGVMLKICIRLCSGALCFLMRWFVLALTGLYRGCSGGRVARWTAALKHHFST